MMHSIDDNLAEIENICLEKSVQERFVDIHCHCLPCLDDGPAERSEAIRLCQALVDDCISVVIATPHQLGRFNGFNDAAKIREAVSALNEDLESNNISLTVMQGADVRVDERICQLLESDEVLTLADGGRYILLELPHEIFIDIEPLLIDLSSMGIQAVISHPERHCVAVKQYKTLLKWLNTSACLQLTAGSLLGDFGLTAQEVHGIF